MSSKLDAFDLYPSAGKKIGHFCLGFFGTQLIFLLVHAMFVGVMDSVENEALLWLYPLGLLIAVIWSIVHYFRAGKRYIAIGIIMAVVLPLIAFGACVVMVLSMMGQL